MNWVNSAVKRTSEKVKCGGGAGDKDQDSELHNEEGSSQTREDTMNQSGGKCSVESQKR